MKTPRSPLPRHPLTALAAAALLLPGTASALDAYRDRTGLFYGGGLGFGAGKSDADGAETKAGLNLSGRIGGGVNENLTLDFTMGLTKQLDVDTTLVSGFVGTNLFVAGDLSVRLMGGIAHASLDGADGETGFGAGAGLGYEFWANADLAVGVGADYQHLFFDAGSFNTINFGVTFTVY
ncbi:porin family protein [Myxococcota bacterium]|nr:porin family protein [Myxococcota bacterium]